MGFWNKTIAVLKLQRNWSALTIKMEKLTTLSDELMLEVGNIESEPADEVARWFKAVRTKRVERIILSDEYDQHIHSCFCKRCFNFKKTISLSYKVSSLLKRVREVHDQLHSAEAFRKGNSPRMERGAANYSTSTTILETISLRPSENFQDISTTTAPTYTLPPPPPPPITQIPGSVPGNRDPMENFFSEMERRNPIRFTHTQLQSFTSNFSSPLGSGGYGEVYKGQLPDRKLIAVKVLKYNFNDEVQGTFMAEVGTVCTTHHRNLVKLYGFCFDINMKAVVYEYMENGSLDKILFHNNHIMEWERLQNIAIGTAKGLSYLHEDCHQTIIHYDIKPGNILLDSNFCPKIGDFGVAKLYSRDISNVPMSRYRGTPGYAAPELWDQNSIVTSKCDVYSYGVMLFELVGRRRNMDPRLEESQTWFPKQVWEKFEKGELDEFLAQCGLLEGDRVKAKKICKLALCCIQRIPTDRPSMSKVVKILEGDRDAMEPPNPFPHLYSPAVSIISTQVAFKIQHFTP